MSIPEKEMDADEETEATGRLLVETTFISVPDATTGNHIRNIGKQKHVRISTGSTPEETENVFPNPRLAEDRRLSEFEHDATESTPFCP